MIAKSIKKPYPENMIEKFGIKTITDETIKNTTVLVRVDFDISLTPNHEIADDTRMTHTLPTLTYLLKNNNKLILVSKLNRPKTRDLEHSLKIVADRLQTYLTEYTVTLIDDFLSQEGKAQIASQKEKEIIILENIRFYPQEKANDPVFAKQLASLAEVFVMDAFAMSHRTEASVVGISQFLPHYAGLLMEEEINAILKVMDNPKKPVVAIIGGAKTSDKLPLLYKLAEIADYLLLGGGIANTFLHSEGFSLGNSLVESGQEEEVKKITSHAHTKNTTIILPRDAICATDVNQLQTQQAAINHIPEGMGILDIGPETQALFGSIINKAETIIWNGPVGYTENPIFSRGTAFLYYAITQNDHAYSLVGGGDTLAAINKREYLDKITHISTGGGAMLEFIEKGTLPGIEALK